VISFNAKNVGTEGVTDARVLVEVVGAQTITVFNDTVAIPGNGGDVPLTALWSAAAGRYTVRVTIDPFAGTAELNEENNVAELAVTVRAPPQAAVPPLLWIGLGGGLAAVAAGAVLALRRRRTPVDPGEEAVQQGKA